MTGRGRELHHLSRYSNDGIYDLVCHRGTRGGLVLRTPIEPGTSLVETNHPAGGPEYEPCCSSPTTSVCTHEPTLVFL